MTKYTRCEKCGIRIPEKHLKEHKMLMHGLREFCSVCGKRLVYSQYSHAPYCPRCTGEVENGQS